MSVNIHLVLLTKEQLDQRDDKEALLAGEKIDFSDIVHEGYKTFWISPRDWFFEDFLERKLTWDTGAIYQKQDLLNMLPKAREYLNDPENEFDASTIAAIRADYLELEISLLNFNEDTHVLLGSKC